MAKEKKKITQEEWDEMEQSGFRFYAAGVKFKLSNYKQVKDLLEPGLDIQLITEPTNEFDPHAVKLEFMGQHIGYVPATFSKFVTERVEKAKATVHAVDQTQPTWKQLKVEIHFSNPGAMA